MNNEKIVILNFGEPLGQLAVLPLFNMVGNWVIIEQKEKNPLPLYYNSEETLIPAVKKFIAGDNNVVLNLPGGLHPKYVEKRLKEQKIPLNKIKYIVMGEDEYGDYVIQDISDF